ncbi:MAG: polysulfide reductase NrfD [Candidatus Rokubacteria bacterium]|nr:polysulfide reductase NrfD [Candidatus Rokubacteria bacterium]
MDDAWIPSACSLCYNQCGIRVHKKNGVVVKIEGNPESPLGMGRLCPKGLAGIMLLYDPHRLKVPLKRTNPLKGIHVDPGWVEITWEEALATITEKLRKIRAEDPRKLVLAGCVPSLSPLVFGMGIFMPAFGSSNVFVSNGHQCGNAEHLLAATLHGALTTNPDLEHTNYLLVFGSHCGTAAYYATMIYTGLLLGAIRPIPFWSTPILPLLFLVSSLSTGLMAVDLLLTVSAALNGNPADGILEALRMADLFLLALEATVVVLYLSLAHATVATRASRALLTVGALARRFWGGVVLAGIVVPFILQLLEVTYPIPGEAAWAMVSSSLGLLGGLFLRHVVIAGGVKSPLNAAGLLFATPSRGPHPSLSPLAGGGPR